MSLFDDDRPVKKPSHEIGADLSLLSVDEISSRIEILLSEIKRLEAEKAAKSASKSAAASLFKI